MDWKRSDRIRLGVENKWGEKCSVYNGDWKERFSGCGSYVRRAET